MISDIVENDDASLFDWNSMILKSVKRDAIRENGFPIPTEKEDETSPETEEIIRKYSKYFVNDREDTEDQVKRNEKENEYIADNQQHSYVQLLREESEKEMTLQEIIGYMKKEYPFNKVGLGLFLNYVKEKKIKEKRIAKIADSKSLEHQVQEARDVKIKSILEPLQKKSGVSKRKEEKDKKSDFEAMEGIEQILFNLLRNPVEHVRFESLMVLVYLIENTIDYIYPWNEKLANMNMKPFLEALLHFERIEWITSTVHKMKAIESDEKNQRNSVLTRLINLLVENFNPTDLNTLKCLLVYADKIQTECLFTMIEPYMIEYMFLPPDVEGQELSIVYTQFYSLFYKKGLLDYSHEVFIMAIDVLKYLHSKSKSSLLIQRLGVLSSIVKIEISSLDFVDHALHFLHLDNCAFDTENFHNLLLNTINDLSLTDNVIDSGKNKEYLASHCSFFRKELDSKVNLVLSLIVKVRDSQSWDFHMKLLSALRISRIFSKEESDLCLHLLNIYPETHHIYLLNHLISCNTPDSFYYFSKTISLILSKENDSNTIQLLISQFQPFFKDDSCFWLYEMYLTISKSDSSSPLLLVLCNIMLVLEDPSLAFGKNLVSWYRSMDFSHKFNLWTRMFFTACDASIWSDPDYASFFADFFKLLLEYEFIGLSRFDIDLYVELLALFSAVSYFDSNFSCFICIPLTLSKELARAFQKAVSDSLIYRISIPDKLYLEKFVPRNLHHLNKVI